jgi:hypothetical protein
VKARPLIIQLWTLDLAEQLVDARALRLGLREHLTDASEQISHQQRLAVLVKRSGRPGQHPELQS